MNDHRSDLTPAALSAQRLAASRREAALLRRGMLRRRIATGAAALFVTLWAAIFGTAGHNGSGSGVPNATANTPARSVETTASVAPAQSVQATPSVAPPATVTSSQS